MRRIKRGAEGRTADKETRERRRTRMTANKEVEAVEDEDKGVESGEGRASSCTFAARGLSSLFIQYSTKVHSIHPYTLAHETPRDVCKWLVTNDLVIPVAPLAPGRRVRSGIIRCRASL